MNTKWKNKQYQTEFNDANDFEVFFLNTHFY